MKKLILAILMLASLVYAKEKVEMTVVSIDSDGMGATLKGDGFVQKGVTGIVVTKLDDQRSAIVAAARAINSGNEIKVRFEMFSDLAQEALPRAMVLPRVGDKGLFYLFDDRATIIAKNQADYQKVAASDNKTWVHPDLFAALLTKERVGEPKAKHISSFCRLYSVGTIYFAIRDKIYITDCQSMEILEERAFASDNQKEFDSPFYRRTGEIDTGYLGILKESVKDYDSYYLRVLGL